VSALFITETGMACPVGLSAPAACAAKRAGISAFASLPYRDSTRNPIVGAAVMQLDWAMEPEKRLVALLIKAVAEVLSSQEGMRWELVPLLMCLADPGRPGGAADRYQAVLEHLQSALEIRFHPSKSNIFAFGHAAGFMALHSARVLLESGVPACVVCGVDSFVNAETLSWLGQHQRLKTRFNRDGVIPGEAAAAVLIQPKPSARTLVEVTGLGIATEETPILSRDPQLGHGLAAAARDALAEARSGYHEMDLRLSDVTGELYGFKELALVEGRLMRIRRDVEQPIWHWAEAIGDTGAAAGIAQLVLIDEAFRKGYAPGDRAICLTSSVPGGRAVAVIQRCGP
jgi:3-oxoacyl-[acyl-carrier-protein] synthase-1